MNNLFMLYFISPWGKFFSSKFDLRPLGTHSAVPRDQLSSVSLVSIHLTSMSFEVGGNPTRTRRTERPQSTLVGFKSRTFLL